MDIDEYSKLLHKQEELHPSLSDYLETQNGWKCLKHPFVFGVPYHQGMNAVYNEQYKFKLERIAKAEEDRDWNSYIYLHERPHRIEAFFNIQELMTDEEYWENLGSIWTDSENLWQYRSILSALLNASRSHKEKIMDENEYDFFNKLPDEFVIYRGHQNRNRSGHSWTLSFWHAQWFSVRLATKEIKVGVVKALCRKKDIHAVLLGRREFEIVVDPKKLKIQKLPTIERSPQLQKVLHEAKSVFTLASRQSFHGPWHWDKVEMNAIQLCKLEKDADVDVCRAFALVHDCKRVDENEDPEHGLRSAKWVLERKDLFSYLSDKQIMQLAEACRFHNDGKTTTDPTLGVCWDADRLDLPRVGITPDPKRLSTAAGKSLVWRV